MAVFQMDVLLKGSKKRSRHGAEASSCPPRPILMGSGFSGATTFAPASSHASQETQAGSRSLNISMIWLLAYITRRRPAAAGRNSYGNVTNKPDPPGTARYSIARYSPHHNMIVDYD